MKSRAVGVGLLVVAVLVVGGLWYRLYRLRQDVAAYESRRLNNPGMQNGPSAEPGAQLGYATSESVAPNAAGAAPTPSSIAPATTLTATLGGQALRLSDESPLDGAIVEVLGAPGSDGTPEVLCVTNSVPDGRFFVTAPGLAPTAIRVWFPVDWEPPEPPPAGHAGFHLGYCVVHTEPLSPADAHRLDLTIHVDTGWVLWGTVSDTAGHTVVGGVVNLIEPHEFSLIDPQGQYRLRDLPPSVGPLALMVSGPGVRSETVEAPAQPADVHVTRFDIHLAPAAMIFGQVQWGRASGKPLMPPLVTVLNPPADTAPGSEITRPAVVDLEGRYQLDGLGPGRWDLSCAWSTVEGNVQRTFTVYARAVELGSGAKVQHDFVLPGGATLELTAKGADGAPLAGRRVEICHVLDPADPASPPLSEVFGTIDADGRCTFADLAPGTKEVRLLSPASVPQPGVPPEMPVRLATERVDLAEGSTPFTIVAGAR